MIKELAFYSSRDIPYSYDPLIKICSDFKYLVILSSVIYISLSFVSCITERFCFLFEITLLENYIIDEDDFFNDYSLYDKFVSLSFDPKSTSLILNFLSSS